MAGDDNRFPHLSQASQQVAHFDTSSRVETAQGFIQQEHGWVVKQHASEPKRWVCREIACLHRRLA